MAKKKTFETALTDLENIVKDMESGELSLESAMKNYENGLKQSKYCFDLLDKTEKKISLLKLDKQGNIKEKTVMNG
ncbi:exodeoxyribonuclease VII small subunit [bacterium]|nr:exodeoxyribonuclease VII small subunit [bacterium]